MKIHNISLLAALAAGALVALTPQVRAQEQPQRPNRPDRAERPEPGPRARPAVDRIKRMAEELNLNEDQKAKLQEVFQAQRESRQDLRDATPEERREAMKTAREEMNAKLKEILTSEQYAKWQKLRAENRPGPGGPGGPDGKRRAPGGGRPE